MATPAITGCKTFTATRAREREELGDVLTRWIADHPELAVTSTVVVQSSDNAYHCLSIVAFYGEATP